MEGGAGVSTLGVGGGGGKGDTLVIPLRHSIFDITKPRK